MGTLDYDRVVKVLVAWLKEKIENAGAKGAVIGLSGGIDSSVTAVLCKQALGDNLLGITMPCYSSKKDLEDACLVADKFDINYLIKDLSPVLSNFLQVLDESKEIGQSDMVVANMKPRLRMITLYYYAARNNYLVVGTDNWSELKVGYFTKYGDGGVDLAPLGRLVKTEVKELARYLGIPDKIIDKPPSAGLWEGQTDEGEMGLSYELLDKYILTGEVPLAARKRIEELVKRSVHKLNSIPIPERKSLI